MEASHVSFTCGGYTKFLLLNQMLPLAMILYGQSFSVTDVFAEKLLAFRGPKMARQNVESANKICAAKPLLCD